jgi:hypothetical protein
MRIAADVRGGARAVASGGMDALVRLDNVTKDYDSSGTITIGGTRGSSRRPGRCGLGGRR